jgi:hypothetical protein
MAASRIFLVCLLAALVLVSDQTVKVGASRELRGVQDSTIVGCKSYGKRDILCLPSRGMGRSSACRNLQ